MARYRVQLLPAISGAGGAPTYTQAQSTTQSMLAVYKTAAGPKVFITEFGMSVQGVPQENEILLVLGPCVPATPGGGAAITPAPEDPLSSAAVLLGRGADAAGGALTTLPVTLASSMFTGNAHIKSSFRYPCQPGFEFRSGSAANTGIGLLVYGQNGSVAIAGSHNLRGMICYDE